MGYTEFEVYNFSINVNDEERRWFKRNLDMDIDDIDSDLQDLLFVDEFTVKYSI